MKKFFLLAVFILASLKIFAQEHKETDTLKVKWKGSRIWIFNDKQLVKKDSVKKDKKKSKNFTHWKGIDIGVCMLTTVDNKFKLSDEKDTTKMNNFLDLNYGKSLFFSLNLLQKSIRVYKNYVKVVTGLGFEWNSYNFNQNITLAPNAPYISASNTSIAPDSVKYIKNKLRAAFIKAPLLIELNSNTTNSDRSFHISGGIELGYRLSSNTKQVYELSGYEYKVKRSANYNLADFKYSAVVRAGYGNYFTAFVNYGLSTLFAKDKGPEIFPLTAGISIALF